MTPEPSLSSDSAAGSAALPASASKGRSGTRARARAEVLEEVVVVVNSHAIYLSELELEVRLFRAQNLGADRLWGPVLPVELSAAIERMVERTLVYSEAERLQVFEVPQAELERTWVQWQELIGEERLQRFLVEFGCEESELLARFRRELRAQRYLDGRFRLASRPREQEVLAAVEAARAQGRSVSPDALRVAMARERFIQASEGFVNDLRRRAKVRVVRDPLLRGHEDRLWGTAVVDEGGAGQAHGGQLR